MSPGRTWLAALAVGALACHDGADRTTSDGAPQVEPMVAAPSALADRARALHRDAIVVDTHSDTTPRFEDPTWRFDERHTTGHMDLPRIREGGLDVQFWSIYMGARDGRGVAIREAIERIDAVHELARRHPLEIALVGSVSEIRDAVAAGKLASLMGVEGGHIIEQSLPALRTFYRLGVRYMTLTHSFHTEWADSAGTYEPREPLHRGLTAFGREVVAEMNRLGMLVDVSHVSDDTFHDVLQVTRAPVIASHSSCRAVADHPRNLSDDMLRALARNGGVVMINFFPVYINEENAALAAEQRAAIAAKLETLRPELGDDPAAVAAARAKLYAESPWPTVPLAVLLDHFDHAIRVAGAEHVGIGADWDGVPSMPEGMEDVSRLPALTEGLLARGHSDTTVRAVLGENLLRVLAEAEGVAATLREGPPHAEARDVAQGAQAPSR
jgi:membrane dipeptidase